MSHTTRRRGITLVEVVTAAALATVLIGAYAAEVARQHGELGHAAEVARAAAALRDAHERAVGGALVAPAIGETLALPTTERDGLTVTVRRAPQSPVDAALEGLVPVVVRAEWVGRDGRPAARELVTLASAGPEEGR